MRRRLVVAGALAMPLGARAAEEGPIAVGTLTPLTGAGAGYGAAMRDVAAGVVKQANDAGGILGRPVRLVSEDDRGDPEAGAQAARRLIEGERVVAILGVPGSALAMAVAPPCWEGKAFLATCAGADGITQLPHNGYLVRTQPNASAQGAALVTLARGLKMKKPFFAGPQTAESEPLIKAMNKGFEPDGIVVGSARADAGKPSARGEVEAAMKGQADGIVVGGDAAETGALLRELSRAGFKGRVIAARESVSEKLLGELPKEATEGMVVLSPGVAAGGAAYKAATGLVGKTSLDPYTAQVFDQVNLVLLAMQLAGVASGTAIKDLVRRVSQGDGPKVGELPEGLKALKDGAKQLDYEGASGPCTFDAAGDLSDPAFVYEQVKGGKLVPFTPG